MSITLNGSTITLNDSSTITSTTTHLAIGSFHLLGRSTNGTTSAGSTVAGTTLKYGVGDSFRFYNGTGPTMFFPNTGTAASGTWRLMDARAHNASTDAENGFLNAPCLYARVS